VAVRNDNNVDILRLVSGSREAFSRLPGWQPFAELLVLAWKSPIAGVEQNQLLPGIHKRWNVGMFEPLGIDIVGAGERVHLINRSIRAILRVQTLANRLGIQDSSDLKSAEPKTIDRRL
jgi:hypothetical protein